MRIICPTCTSHYEIDAAKIAATGQLVRCAQCREVWLVQRSDDPALAIDAEGIREARGSEMPARRPGALVGSDNADTLIDFEAARTRLQARAGRSGVRSDRASGTTLGALAAGLVLAGSIVAFAAARHPVVSHFPAAAGLYAAVGVPVNVQGLALRDVHSALARDGDKTVLTLEGRIANVRGSTAAVPDLTVVVRDGNQSPLYTWQAAPPKASLASGETVQFRSRLVAPPRTGQDVRVSFAEGALKQ